MVVNNCEYTKNYHQITLFKWVYFMYVSYNSIKLILKKSVLRCEVLDNQQTSSTKLFWSVVKELVKLKSNLLYCHWNQLAAFSYVYFYNVNAV